MLAAAAAAADATPVATPDAAAASLPADALPLPGSSPSSSSAVAAATDAATTDAATTAATDDAARPMTAVEYMYARWDEETDGKDDSADDDEDEDDFDEAELDAAYGLDLDGLASGRDFSKQLASSGPAKVGGGGGSGSAGGKKSAAGGSRKTGGTSGTGGKKNAEALGSVGSNVRKQAGSSGKSATTTGMRHTGRDDRATVEQVMDPRTRMILFKLLSTGYITEIHGCISTGKEANVYYAKSGDGGDVAIKVFKTSILVFKDRDRYVTGEFRFRNGYCKSNPRKMVKVWAEKEMRNLRRLEACGIVCPEPMLLKQHVLLMRFIGRNGWPAPRIKDAKLEEGKLRSAYMQCVKMMRNMFHKCKLVHGDLSEYNMLWYKSTLYFIDVSQSVEHDHPHALEFLRKDCMNVTAFFTKGGVGAMWTRELYEFVTDPALTDEDVDEYLSEMQDTIAARPQERTGEMEVSENVFMQSFIPRSLYEVRNHEMTSAGEAIASSESDGIFYRGVAGLISGGEKKGEDDEDGDEDGDEGEDGEDGYDDDGEERARPRRGACPCGAKEGEPGCSECGVGEDGEAGPLDGEGRRRKKKAEFTRKGASKEEKAAHKKAIKEARKEGRKTKIPKHLKKQHRKRSANR